MQAAGHRCEGLSQSEHLNRKSHANCVLTLTCVYACVHVCACVHRCVHVYMYGMCVHVGMGMCLWVCAKQSTGSPDSTQKKDVSFCLACPHSPWGVHLSCWYYTSSPMSSYFLPRPKTSSSPEFLQSFSTRPSRSNWILRLSNVRQSLMDPYYSQWANLISSLHPGRKVCACVCACVYVHVLVSVCVCACVCVCVLAYVCEKHTYIHEFSSILFLWRKFLFKILQPIICIFTLFYVSARMSLCVWCLQKSGEGVESATTGTRAAM